MRYTELELLRAGNAGLLAETERMRTELSLTQAVKIQQAAEIERLRKSARNFLVEQTDENAANLAEVLGWVKRSDDEQKGSDKT